MPYIYLKSRFTRSVMGVVMAVLIAVLGWFTCLYAGLTDRKEAERDAAWDLPVEVVVSNLRGTSVEGLGISGADLMAFTAYKGDFDNVTYVLPLDLAPYFSQVRVKSFLYYSAEGGSGPLVGVTSLSAVEDFDPRLGTARVTYFEGGEEDFAAAEGQALIVPESLLAYTVEDGERHVLPMSVSMGSFDMSNAQTLEAVVTGYYSGTSSQAVYCSWAMSARLAEALGHMPSADSVSATVADPRGLEELREKLSYYFTEPDPAGTPKPNPNAGGSYRFAAIVHDETLRDTLRSIDRGIGTLKRLRPLMLLLELGIAASAAFFFVHMRRRELAVARSLGTPRAAVVRALLIEMLVWCAAATALALGAALAMPLCVLSPVMIAAVDLAALAGTAAGGLKATSKAGILSLKEET